MDTTRVIKIIVALQLIITILYIVASAYFQDEIPALLQVYNNANPSYVGDIAWMIYMLIYISSVIGIFFYKIMGKIYIYFFLGIMGNLERFELSESWGTYVEHGIPMSIDFWRCGLTGAAIALLLFSNSAFSTRRSLSDDFL